LPYIPYIPYIPLFEGGFFTTTPEGYPVSDPKVQSAPDFFEIFMSATRYLSPESGGIPERLPGSAEIVYKVNYAALLA
jgi:hypothetical protein